MYTIKVINGGFIKYDDYFGSFYETTDELDMLLSKEEAQVRAEYYCKTLNVATEVVQITITKT